MAKIAIGVTGASGVVLAHLATKTLIELGFRIDLVFSKAAALTACEEMGREYGTAERWIASFPEGCREKVKAYREQDFTAPIASGSSPCYGMLVIPCSMATLAGIAHGLSDNLIRRAADVMLKERRPLVVVPRESPFSEIHLKNMLELTRAGGIIVPPIPAWYNHPRSLDDVHRFIVGRALDAMKIEHQLYPRWAEELV